MAAELAAQKNIPHTESAAGGFARRLWRQRGAAAGLVLTALIVLVALLAPLIAPNDPLEVDIANKLAAPGGAFPLGTDNLGRCLASRLIWGARLSLTSGLCVLGLMLAVSVPVGLAAGYIGGRVDAVIMRIIDICLAMPTFILAIAVAGTLGPGVGNMVLAMALVWWAPYARLIRGMAMRMKEQDFMLAARAAGCTHLHMVVRHILRNIAPSIITMATLEVGPIILAIAGFCFIGLGAQAPTPEWGVMLSDSKEFIQTQPRLMAYPGLAIMLTVTAFNLLGEGLKNAADKRS